MLNIGYEFRKGIFFVRLFGDLNKTTYLSQEKELTNLINYNQFKYIVINTNYLKSIDLNGLNYLTKIICMTKQNDCNLIICDKFKVIKTLLNNNIQSISNELEVL